MIRRILNSKYFIAFACMLLVISSLSSTDIYTYSDSDNVYYIRSARSESFFVPVQSPQSLNKSDCRHTDIWLRDEDKLSHTNNPEEFMAADTAQIADIRDFSYIFRAADNFIQKSLYGDIFYLRI